MNNPVALGLALALILPSVACADPVLVRAPEGVTRAFPVLRSVTNEILARGDFSQVVRAGKVHNRLLFRFKDGSIYDESVVFSQGDVFTLQSYRILHQGPSFAETLDAAIDRHTGRYEVRHRADEDSPEEILSGTFALPADAYNGMLSLVAKNLAPLGAGIVSVVAFTPKPRVVQVDLRPMAEERMQISETPMQVTRYHIRPRLGLFASFLLTDVPEVRMWIVPGEAPAFLRAEGPLYFMGPVWRIDPH